MIKDFLLIFCIFFSFGFGVGSSFFLVSKYAELEEYCIKLQHKKKE